MDVETILSQFKVDYQFRLRTRTMREYLRVVSQCLNYTEKTVNNITKKDIRNWMNHLFEYGYKPKTVYNYLGGLKTFFKYCVEEGLLMTDPAKDISYPKLEETLPRYLTVEQLAQLRMLIGGNILDRTIIEVLYVTGVRVSELVHIKHEDINWNERFIVITEGKGKKERIVLFTQECAEYLKKYLENQPYDSPYVFVSPVKHPNPYSIPGIEHRFRLYTKLLGFNLSPHVMRHTFAAHLARKGMPLACIQQLLGHDHIHMTRIYAKLYDSARKEQYDNWM